TFTLVVACAMIWQFASASFMNSGEYTASNPAASASFASCCSSTKDVSPGLATTMPKRAIRVSSFVWRTWKNKTNLIICMQDKLSVTGSQHGYRAKVNLSWSMLNVEFLSTDYSSLLFLSTFASRG